MSKNRKARDVVKAYRDVRGVIRLTAAEAVDIWRDIFGGPHDEWEEYARDGWYWRHPTNDSIMNGPFDSADEARDHGRKYLAGKTFLLPA